MQLLDILLKVKRDGGLEDSIDIDDLVCQFFNNFGDFDYATFYADGRLKAWFFSPRSSGAELVGESALYFDDIPVAYLKRLSHKDRYSFKWLNKTTYGLVKTYLSGLIENTPEVEFLTDKEKYTNFGDGYRVTDVSFVAQKTATFVGTPVEIVGAKGKRLLIDNPNLGKEQDVDVVSVEFQYLLENK
ncbi:hypothetical protein [Vibrio phage vB_VpaP_SJSY21]|nr:hypothetical protein [Vibrio phage vB_VpaP_SJSY21]